MQRRYDLDWLRVIAFGLLMLFHTGMLFSTWDWHVKNLQTHLESPDRRRAFEGLSVAYAAAVSPDPRLPYPHSTWPAPGLTAGERARFAARFENAMGGWAKRLSQYQGAGTPLRPITIEYARDDKYVWLRRGANELCRQMASRGISHALVIDEGNHEWALGRRLETAMVPVMANPLASAR